jgi:hypothetical protein
MELESLKYVWKHLEEDNDTMEGETQILQLIAKKSEDPIARMKHNLLIEFFLAILVYVPLSIWYLLDFNGKLPEVSVFLLLTLLFFSLYYYRKNNLLQQMQDLNHPIKENLERQIGMLEKYLRFYLISGMVIPICILFLAVLMYGKLPHPPGPAIFYIHPAHPIWQVILIWAGILMVATLGIYFADRWYINKLYLSHIRKLKEILREINE